VQRDIHGRLAHSADDLLDHWFATEAIHPRQRLRTSPPYFRRSERQDRRNGSDNARRRSNDRQVAQTDRRDAELFCQRFSYTLPDGRSWHQEKQRAIDLIFDVVNEYAPNFRASVIRPSALSPLDPEEKLGLAGGDIFHGALGLDQLWAARPMLGYGDCRTPLKSLYLCGSGTRPGGGMTGVPGNNAARNIARWSAKRC